MVSLNHIHGRTSGISLSVLTKVLNEVLPNAKDSGIKKTLLAKNEGFLDFRVVF
jgi:hypothetical protein